MAIHIGIYTTYFSAFRYNIPTFVHNAYAIFAHGFDWYEI